MGVIAASDGNMRPNQARGKPLAFFVPVFLSAKQGGYQPVKREGISVPGPAVVITASFPQARRVSTQPQGTVCLPVDVWR